MLYILDIYLSTTVSLDRLIIRHWNEQYALCDTVNNIIKWIHV